MAVHQAAALGRDGQGPISTRLAEALLADGRLAEAWRAATQAVELARLQHERGSEASALLALANVHAQLDGAGPETVERCYTEARELASALSMRPVVAACHLGWGRFLQGIGRGEAAEEHLAIAARLFTAMGLTAPVVHVAARR
jgi:hypothetical protein